MANIPSWFSLDRYKVASQFSADLWLENLRFRSIALLPHEPSTLRVPLKGRYQNEAPELRTESRGHHYAGDSSVWPLVRLDAYMSIAHDGHHKEILKSLCPDESCPVDWDDVRKGAYTLPIDYSKANLSDEKIHKIKQLLGEDYFHRAERWRYTDVFESSHYGDIENISVWLGQPDAVIVDDFKKWLADRRKEKPLVKSTKNKETIFKRWCQYQVLAFLDLKIWATFEEVDLPYHVIGEALFPDDIDIDTTERVRKVTKPLADEAINKETATWLELLARKEIKP